MNFPWQEDENGEYLNFKNQSRSFEVRNDGSSILFLFLGEAALYNHLWVHLPEMDTNEDLVMGVRIWERSMDEVFGDGSFMELCEELLDRDFPVAEEDEPSELDLAAYDETFRNVDEEDLVLKLTRNLDEAWEYYSQEWV